MEPDGQSRVGGLSPWDGRTSIRRVRSVAIVSRWLPALRVSQELRNKRRRCIADQETAVGQTGLVVAQSDGSPGRRSARRPKVRLQVADWRSLAVQAAV
jgi:hypothetical protein